MRLVINMKIIQHSFNKNLENNIYPIETGSCFIDIETTGLSSKYSSIYLIGIMHFDYADTKWKLIQYLAESINEERDLLLSFIDYSKDFNTVITYNGDTFDIPFINERLKVHDISHIIKSDKSMDLYKIVRQYRYMLNIENLKLKTLEMYLGIYRDDKYTGKDCIGFYKDYIKTKDPLLERKLLQHNYDDLYYMIDILEILVIIDDLKSIHIDSNGQSFILHLENLQVSGDVINISGFISENKESFRFMIYDDYYNLILKEDSSFNIQLEYSIGLISSENKALFMDKRKLGFFDLKPKNPVDNLLDNIVVLKVEKEFCMENIKMIIQEIFNSLL